VLAQADAICARLGKQLDDADKLVRNFTPPGLARLTALDIPLEEAALAQLGKLSPPPDARDWQQSIDYRRALLPLLMELHEHASHNDTQGYHATNVIFHKAQYRMLEAAQRTGLEVCSHVG
jgi:hypothetical protein